jgi:alpha-1,2-mannosyltransferase
MGYARNVEGGFHPSIVANFSLAGFFMRVFVGEAQLVRLLTMSCAVVLFGILLYNHLKFRSKQNEAALILPYSILMVIASPVTWLHHLIYLFPGVVFTLRLVWFGREGIKKVLWFAGLTGIIALSAFDFQSVYPTLTISEGLRPFVTSINLISLLVLFFASLSIIKPRISSVQPHADAL